MYSYVIDMSISDEECFDTLVNLMINDIKDKTGEKISRSDLLKGYKYESLSKQGSQIVSSTVEIHKPVVNKNITTVYDFSNRKYKIVYDITPIDEGHCSLEYIQDDGQTTPKGLTKRMMDRNTKKRLLDIEAYAIRSNKADVIGR